MVVPFGVGVGDFIAVGKLIWQISVELGKNSKASPEYQGLLLELEALKRALQQLQNLRPVQHELLQLDSIRAAALLCEIPLRKFLDKISKFEGRLGTAGVRGNRYKGFGRRMQWTTMYSDDAKELRTTLGSHVATIKLLLMTQTIHSLNAAEVSSKRVACSLEQKILANRALLEGVRAQVGFSVAQQVTVISKLERHASTLSSLEIKADTLNTMIYDQNLTTQKVTSDISTIKEDMTSIASTTRDIISTVTSGTVTLKSIACLFRILLKLCTKFTTNIPVALAEALKLLSDIQRRFLRMETNLPPRVTSLTIQFTDALGENMTLPYQLCQHWSTFKQLLNVIFMHKPGKSRVRKGKYRIMNANGGRLITESMWEHMVTRNDHLSMCMVLDDLKTKAGHCPFPSCQVSLGDSSAINGGVRCRNCDRWSSSAPEPADVTQFLSLREHRSALRSISSSLLFHPDDEENIEIYRQVHVKTVQGVPKGLKLCIINPPPLPMLDNNQKEHLISVLDKLPLGLMRKISVQFVSFSSNNEVLKRLDALDKLLDGPLEITHDIIDDSQPHGNISKMLLGSLDKEWDRAEEE
ncbi:hypothetical protein B0J14DRAFT_648919 [Halenospora varia]|nr:hypothetical protein B0J14DRAFT_648919 [Halenospora varia]